MRCFLAAFLGGRLIRGAGRRLESRAARWKKLSYEEKRPGKRWSLRMSETLPGVARWSPALQGARDFMTGRLIFMIWAGCLAHAA